MCGCGGCIETCQSCMDDEETCRDCHWCKPDEFDYGDDD